MTPGGEKALNILLVDDQEDMLVSMQDLLVELLDQDVDIYTAQSGQEALALVKQHGFAVALIDVVMPGMDGFELAEQIRAVDTSENIPIIFQSGVSKDQAFINKGYGAGAVDYILKPFDPSILVSKISVFLQLYIQKEVIKTESSKNRMLLDSSAEGILGVDENGKITFVNPVAAKLLGADTFTITQYHLHQFIYDPADKTTVSWEESPLYRKHKEGLDCHVDMGTLWRMDGSRFPAEYRSNPLFEVGMWRGSVFLFQDITIRKQVEEQLRHSQKMDALGKITGGIAHDFNNQLGVIIGYLDCLKNYMSNDEKPNKWVDIATRATLRCMDLTRQLLAFTHHQSKEKEVVDLNLVLKDLDTMIARTVTPEVDVQYVMVDDLWSTEINPGEFQDAILNLVINARDAMPNGGRLLIETSNKYLDESSIDVIPEIKPGNYIQLMLCDSGTGMARETLERIFEPFFTTKPEGKGTGLGMAMVYGFIKRYGGGIKVYSEPGVGTTLHLYLPQSAANSSALTIDSLPESELPTGHETILIVEDEVELLALADQYLSSLGYHTHLAEDAGQALEILANEDEIDLLFSDVVMPGGTNGYELAYQATQQRPGLKVLLTSGFTPKTMTHNGLARFSAHLLSKPYRKADLAQRIRQVLRETDETQDYLFGRTILVVDDEEDMQNLFKLNLDRLGCKTLLASNGDEAVSLYRQSLESGEAIDSVILDLSLPGSMGGKEVADTLRAMDPQAKMIVASGHTEGPEMTRYRDFGFNAAIEKNFDRNKIKQVLEQVLTSS